MAPTFARVPDGKPGGPGGSHQRADDDEDDDVGLTSYVRRQE